MFTCVHGRAEANYAARHRALVGKILQKGQQASYPLSCAATIGLAAWPVGRTYAAANE